ncbi:GIY-YIG nuclease family protein [Candidatus Gracilibacteria bacterium]|nr:GIY-YIG nuclease family protein [Candidatus Gracilibacteria bacterium]
MKKITSLDDIFNDDELGLLSVKPKGSSAITADERLVTSFQEINNFIKENNKEPEMGKGVQEHRLATRLKSIREDKSKSKALLDFDEFKLLGIEKKEITSVSDVLEDDDLGILDNEEKSLFQLKNVPAHKDRASADYIARRKPCKDFEKYEKLFQKCQADLAAGKRKLVKFNEQQIREGIFFVMNGILLFIDKVFETTKDKNGKVDGRIRCIFENGTESGMLFRSLGKGLYDNGYAVTELINTDEKKLLENFGVITNEDNKTGFIYILKSLSKDSRIQSLQNLFKIGFSTTPIEERIKNAPQDPTYLMAPVAIVTTFECYNLNPQKLEQLLHNFFGSACLNLDIFDEDGQRHTPREWFIAPLSVIEKVTELIINGGIVNYKYDHEQEKILLK